MTPSFTPPSFTPPSTPEMQQSGIDRPQTTAYALCDSPSGLLAYVLDSIRPPALFSAASSPAGSPENLRPQTAGRSPVSPQSYGTPQTARSPRSPAALATPQTLELVDMSSPWTPTALVNWAMLYWLPGPEVPLRWLANSTPLVSSLWATHSSVPLGISYFREPVMPGTINVQPPPQWAEAYHRIAMVRRREGRVRFPAWERPAEIVMDLREFADLMGTGPSVNVTNGV